MATLVGTAVRQVREGDEWVAVTLSPETVPDIDQDDLDALEDVILRDRTAAQVTARSRILLGLPLEDAEDEEVSVPALADFRGEFGGAASGEDGRTMEPAPEPDAGAGG